LETSRPIYFLPVAVPPPVQSELIGSVSYKARALCVAAAKHVVANKQTLTRPPEHITFRQEMTASANFHQLRDVIE
jgi:hypothetical protein